MENPDFLKEKYDLQNDDEVESAARRTEIRTSEVSVSLKKKKLGVRCWVIFNHA